MADQSERMAAIVEALEAMVLDDEDITARGLVRRLDGLLKHATDITRNPERRKTLESYQQRQAEIRAVVSKADKTSKSNLSAQIARKDAEITTLTAQRDLLIASHRAMILAVGEMGGMKAWKKFFSRYQEVVEELRDMGAMPSATVSEFPSREKEDA